MRGLVFRRAHGTRMKERALHPTPNQLTGAGPTGAVLVQHQTNVLEYRRSFVPLMKMPMALIPYRKLEVTCREIVTVLRTSWTRIAARRGTGTSARRWTGWMAVARPNSSGGCPAGTKFAGPPNIIKCNKSATNGICQPRFKETAAYTDCPCPVDTDSDTGRCTPQEVDQLKELKNEFMSEAQKHSQVLEGAIRKVRRQPAGFGAGEPWEAANDPGLQQTFCCMNDEKNCLEMCSRNGCPSDVDLRSKAVNLHNAIANDSGVQDTTKIEKNAIAFYTALETKREKQEGSDPVPSPTPQGRPQGRPTPQGRSTPAAPASQAQKGTGPSWIKVVAVLVAVLVTVVIIVLAIDRFTPRKSTLKVQLPSRAALRQRRVARQQRGQKAKGQVAEIMQRHL